MPYLDPNKNKQAKRRYYEKNKAKYEAYSRQDKIKKRKYITTIKSVPCADCNKKYPFYVMDLDHRNGDEKVMRIGNAVWRMGWKRLRTEVAKCDVVCANCHRERTYQRMK